MRTLWGCAAVVVAALALAPPASAAVVSTRASAGPSAEEYVEYKGEGRENNRVQVHLAADSVVIVDKGVRRIRLGSDDFGRCRHSGSLRRVVCPDYAVYVKLKDGDDTITFAPGTDPGVEDRTNPFNFAEDYEDTEGSITESTYVHGGAGDDRIQGSRFRDWIVPSTGRDKVFSRGGRDWVELTPDDDADYVRAGGGGGDALMLGAARRPVTVDLEAGTVTPIPGVADSIGGFERVHGGIKDDVLLGSRSSDALYGEGGADRIDGRGGSDLITGDSPSMSSGGGPNSLVGGDGNDFVDARSGDPQGATLVECGAGEDNVTGEADDRLDPSCEFIALRFGENPEFVFEQPDYDNTIRAYPVAREPDGDPVYAFACPGGSRPNSGCTGTFVLESADPPVQPYGSAAFTAAPGQTVNVPVELNAAGRAAAAGAAPVVVRVNGELGPPGGAGPAAKLNSGWQHNLSP